MINFLKRRPIVSTTLVLLITVLYLGASVQCAMAKGEYCRMPAPFTQKQVLGVWSDYLNGWEEEDFPEVSG